ncbi:MAG: hypothetical protein LBL00_08760 [Endomicrobium sp.]|jgi:hypothetical protein|nr:hypothetical protein [Endomicrobium sp.]
MEIELSQEQIKQIAQSVADIVAERIGAQTAKDKAGLSGENDNSMNIKEVAQYISMAVITVRRKIRADKSFPLPRDKRKFVFDRKEVERWWEEQKRKMEKIFRPMMKR